MPHVIDSVRGLTIAMTGHCWKPRAEVARMIRKRGGHVTAGSEVTHRTHILVRGYSRQWKYGEYGTKEETAYKYRLGGQNILILEEEKFRGLLEKDVPAEAAPYMAGEHVEWLARPSIEEFQKAARSRGSLDRVHSAKGRIEQAFLRNALLAGDHQGRCSICGDLLPRALLVAAHIKPRAVCSHSERLDQKVAFLLCLLGCDALYERGFISVGDRGEVLTCRLGSVPNALRVHLKRLRGGRCSAWNPLAQKYFEWHLRHRFISTLA